MSLIKNENYINIQGWMVNELNLKGNELIIYATIYGFSQDEDSLFSGSLQYLADWTNSSKQSVMNCLKSLVEKGYITKNSVCENHITKCSYRATKFNGTIQQSFMGIQQSCMGGIQQSCIYNIDINNKEYNKENILGPDEPDTIFQETKDTMGSGVLEENKKERGIEGAGRVPTAKPKRNYNTKPLMQMEVENKKLTRQQKQQMKIKELLDLVPSNWNMDLINVLGEYLDMRINLHLGKIDEVWFQKELDENICPALEKHSERDVINFIRTVVIPKQYKRCFISISGGEQKRNNFNDAPRGYTDKELEAAREEGRLAKEEAIKNGTYRHEF